MTLSRSPVGGRYPSAARGSVFGRHPRSAGTCGACRERRGGMTKHAAEARRPQSYGLAARRAAPLQRGHKI